MNSGLRVAAPPSKPLLVFDGDCNFCKLWIHRWRQLTGEAVDYLPSQDPQVAAQFPEIPTKNFSQAVQFIDCDGVVYTGAEAVFRTLAFNPRWNWLLRWHESSSTFRDLAWQGYEFVAENRSRLSTLTRWLRGLHVEPPSYFLVRWFFLRALGVVYLVAFLSLWMQVNGLIGHNGILPADQYMAAVKQQCEEHGIGLERFHLLPTLCWFDASNASLNFQCAAGAGLAVLLIFGLAPAPVLFLLWLLYLSLTVVGRDFLGFQWDNLLLETGLLAVFFAPLQLLPRQAREAPPSWMVLWLLRLLLFKLMFLSGCVKLLSGDPTWHQLTALTYHYQTQPLPPWTAWYAQQFPLWFQKCSCACVLAIELGAPFLIFKPRRLRFVGGAVLVSLQLLILLTGNYTFFNWLTLALCLLLLDDRRLLRLLPMRLRVWFSLEPESVGRLTALRWPRPILVLFAVMILSTSGLIMLGSIGMRLPMLAPVRWVAEQLQPFRSVNSYGLFAVMTTQRNEIIVEGSDDGVNWKAYEFKYKPGDINQRPAFVAPFQPRLDWQMWFAALGDARQNPWFVGFCERLLQGSPDVLALLAVNPFPAHPPRYVRAEFYNYQFTNLATRRLTGAWWQRFQVGEYLPPISLKQ